MTSRVQRGLLDLGYGLVPGGTPTSLPLEHCEDSVSVSKSSEGLSGGSLEGLTSGLCPLEGTKSEKGGAPLPGSWHLPPLPTRALLGLLEL